MAATRGPVPKRESQRRRRNTPAAGEPVEAASPVAVIPEPDEGWHDIARRWFDSLRSSGQSQFYTSGDWMTAYVVAESMSRAFKSPEPIPGSTMASWRSMMATLLVTEGDRRRVALELTVKKPEGEAAPDVARIADYRSRFQSG